MTGERVTRTPRLKRAIGWAAMCGLMLVLFAGQVLALGLGRIEVKSRAGEPLLAEIQVISNDPAELDALRARLASPDTFRRIGLPAPDATVSGLEFTVALDVRGNPVIRVTTREPVTQSALTFLVEVDWGQGRLVREYSALVDTPQTVSAPAQPTIEAPVAAPSNTIVRAPASAAEPDAGAAGAAPEAVTEIAEGDASAVQADAPPATPLPAPAPAAAPPAAALAGEYGPVQAGETLGQIAQQLVGEGISRDQAIVALFRANPQAFIANNLNLVRQGAVLRIPDRSEIAGLDLGESRALMREQIAAWRDMTRPAPQPEAAAPAGEGIAGQAGEGDVQGAGSATAADARLEIVPPSAGSGQQAGIRSGIQAGGEGEMLRQEMQQELHQSQETLAAREAEVAELKARVADLEQLQSRQASLIEMKDSEMAAVQERLASSSADAATPAAADPSGGLAWLWIGLALLAVAGGAWLLGRRAPKATPRPRFDSVTLTAATATAPTSREGGGNDVAPAPARPTPTPTWHADAGKAPAAVAAPERASEATVSPAPAPAPVEGQDAADAAMIASLNPAPGGAERIELARAYLDLGDTETARELLREVADAGDPAASAEASRLLDGIA